MTTDTKPCDMCGKACMTRRTYHTHAGIRAMLCNHCYTDEIIRPIVERLEANDHRVLREYRFDSERRFKFDIAIPTHRVAIEIDGGVFIKSGHSGGKNAEAAMARGNLACMLGWMVLHYTPKMAMNATKVVEEVIRTIENRGGK